MATCRLRNLASAAMLQHRGALEPKEPKMSVELLHSEVDNACGDQSYHCGQAGRICGCKSAPSFETW